MSRKKYAYYSEWDPKAAAWIRELIKAGAITDGEVDERSIEDVVPADLAGFQRCHFFAGIGVWDYALNRAGWPDDRRVWTGSCPCQPFSAAGKGGGFDDERHLWPAWFHLINVGRPDTVFGEQVASKDGLTWLDLVSSDVEGIGYTIAPLDIPAAGFGAPHIRQRLFFVANSDRRPTGSSNVAKSIRAEQSEPSSNRGSLRANPLGENATGIGRRGRRDGDSPGDERQIQTVGLGSFGGGLDDSGGNEHRTNRGQTRETDGISSDGGQTGLSGRSSGASGDVSKLGNANRERLERLGTDDDAERRQDSERPARLPDGAVRPDLTNGFWRDAEWIYCTDEKYRPAKPGIFPLAHGVAGRVGLLRGYGNAINGEVATEFIKAYLEVTK